MQVSTPCHFSKGVSSTFVPGFHFCIFNCKIASPEINVKLVTGVWIKHAKAREFSSSLQCAQKRKSHAAIFFLIGTSSNCEMGMWWDTKRGTVKLLLLLRDPDSVWLVSCDMAGLAPVLREVHGQFWEFANSMKIPVTSTTSIRCLVSASSHCMFTLNQIFFAKHGACIGLNKMFN